MLRESHETPTISPIISGARSSLERSLTVFDAASTRVCLVPPVFARVWMSVTMASLAGSDGFVSLQEQHDAYARRMLKLEQREARAYSAIGSTLADIRTEKARETRVAHGGIDSGKVAALSSAKEARGGWWWWWWWWW